jgi:hypothetical protein
MSLLGMKERLAYGEVSYESMRLLVGMRMPLMRLLVVVGMPSLRQPIEQVRGLLPALVSIASWCRYPFSRQILVLFDALLFLTILLSPKDDRSTKNVPIFVTNDHKW